MSGPSWTDPVWQQNPAFRNDPGLPRSGEGSDGSRSMPQPPFDPDEPWSDLPLPDVVPNDAVIILADQLREAGVPVRGSQVRRAGLFSKGKARVSMQVPTRCLSAAKLMVTKHFG